MSGKWRIRFSMRSLLFAMLLCSLFLTWLSIQTAKSCRQAEAVKQLQSLGATVYYDFQLYYDQNGEGCLNQARAPSTWIYSRKLLGNDLFSKVYHVRFAALTPIPQRPGGTHFLGPVDTPTELSSEANRYLGVLKELPGLHTLDLSSSNLTDEDIPALAQLKSLKWLYLFKTSVSQEGIVQLQGMLPECEIYRR